MYLTLLHHHKIGLLSSQTICKGIRYVSFLEGQVVIQQVVDHRELEVLLELLERVLVFSLLMDQMANEVIVSLVQVAEIGDLFAKVITLLLL